MEKKYSKVKLGKFFSSLDLKNGKNVTYPKEKIIQSSQTKV